MPTWLHQLVWITQIFGICSNFFLSLRSLDPVANKLLAFGRCCPRSSNCCSYGYCINPDDTCCPDGPCDPGWNCCGSNCSPKDGDCCSDGNYCEAGNICVRLGSSGRIVCCTDLECTAAVVSGTTTYASSAQDVVPTLTESPPEITSPPTSQIITVGDSFTTWYWTVTWWYYSFYWSTFQAESTVTFTRLFETTTFTTTATDESEASSLFSALSQTLTFTPPADAQTSLASLLNVVPSETESFSFEDPFSTGFPNGPERTGSTSTTRGSASARATTAGVTQGPVGPPGGASMANGNLVPMALVAVGAISGILMIWL